MISSVKLKSFQIPTFYNLLEEHGFESVPPQSNYEVYRGQLNGSKICINLEGQVNHSNDRKVQEIIDLVLEEMKGTEKDTETTTGKTSKYMILAKPSSPSYDNYHLNHLNIWLSRSQYDYAIELFQNNDTIKTKQVKYDFEEYRFEFAGRTIRFHENGKVIAEDGYAQFGSLLSKAIQYDLPFSQFELIIGQDEVGNGEYIGPLVVGSVAASPEELVDLQLIGIKDSKMVPRGITQNMTHWIRQTASAALTNQLNPFAFNKIRLEEQKSVNDILVDLHNDVVERMKAKLKQLGIFDKKIVYIVDQFDQYQNLSVLEEDKHMDIEIKYLSHGEQKSVSVAAASLLAKYDQVRWLQLHEKVHNIHLKRKELNKIRRHEYASKLLKSI